jgi:hypothetical protein
MTLGDLVAVEFGDGGAFYGYDVRTKLPFDVTRPVGTTVDGPNSLKYSNRILWMRHQDGIHGWNRWEDMFEGTLKEHFGICSNTANQHIPAYRATSSQFGENNSPIVSLSSEEKTPLPEMAPREKINIRVGGEFSIDALHAFAKSHGLKVQDMRELNGNLWVRTNAENYDVYKVLRGWGFRYKSHKGWWR